MPTVLVVDDEPHIREVLRGYLGADGHHVLEAASGEDALAVLAAEHVDLVLLDVMLPGIDGLETLRRLRTTSQVFVILVTARAEEVDTLIGLAVGADDYVTKPFSPREVAARVTAVLRRDRGQAADADELRYDGFVLDRARHEVSVDGEPVTLSSLEFDLLAALAAAPGRVLSRGQLLRQVWGDDWFGDERVVDVHIRSIRVRLGDDAADPRFVGDRSRRRLQVRQEVRGRLRRATMSARLPVRMLAAFLAVLAIGTVVSLVTVRALAPQLFAGRMGSTNGRMMGGQLATDTRAAMIASLDQAMLVGGLVAAVIAGLAAVLLARGVLRPLESVRSVTRQIAAGRYDVRVPEPGEPEMAALAADVNTLAGALADTETRRVRLLGEVAHEMRTPLTGLSGYVEGLVDGVFSPDESTLNAMGEDLRRLRRLADDLSALSRNEEGRLDLHPTPCDLADVVRRTAAGLEPRLSAAGVRLEVAAGDPRPVVADRDRIGQVLTNLLSNAARAVAQAAGPGTAPGVVTVTTATSGPWATVSVTDTGVGIAAQDLEQVFERFYRVPGAARGDGSGIGLTIARGIARAHGGDLTARSAGPGHGATFVLTLPAAT